MHRTQISLEDWQYEKIKDVSRKEKKSLSLIIRDLITGAFSPGTISKEEDPLSRIIGIGCGDGSSAARNHDKHLYGGEK
jgi:predicted DNA-binding ribbon-helix-helix protein